MTFIRQTTLAVAPLLLFAAAVGAVHGAPLADAVESKNAIAIRDLLAKGAEVNARQVDGMSALHWAAHHDDPATVRRLLAAGADAKAMSRYGVTPLALACTNGSSAIIEMLLEAGADPNCKLLGGETALMTAARTGVLDAVSALLARGADVNAREDRQQTALMWAAAEGHLPVVDVLLTHEADSRTSLRSGFSPFFFAVREGRADVALRLIRQGIDVNDPMQPRDGKGKPTGPGTTALILAIENGHFDLADALLKAGARPNDRPRGFTVLHALTWVRKPLRGDGNPPPIGSGKLNSLDMVRQLVAHGADINVRLENGESGRGQFTTTGSTPFLMAARSSDVPLLKLLMDLGADRELANADNCPPLLAAAGVGALGDGDESAGTDDEAVETIRVLLQLGANVNAVDENGETAMHGAAYQSRPKVVQWLVENGADIQVWNRKNKAGWTPLMIAQGHRPANFRPAPDTIAAIEAAMRASGVEPPKPD